jgi:toxin-antitoxin system PIN domain toxin
MRPTGLAAGRTGAERVARFEPVLISVVRIATHPAIRTPAPRPVVANFIDACRSAPGAVGIRAEARHWDLCLDLCTRADARGNFVQDAYLAALALEHNCTYITTERDFAEFPGLRWQHPLDHQRPTQNPACTAAHGGPDLLRRAEQAGSATARFGALLRARELQRRPGHAPPPAPFEADRRPSACRVARLVWTGSCAGSGRQCGAPRDCDARRCSRDRVRTSAAPTAHADLERQGRYGAVVADPREAL